MLLYDLDKYKNRAIDILNFAINHNKKISKEAPLDDYYICNELGGVKRFKNENYYEVGIFVDVDTNDGEIKASVDKLLEFNKWC